MRQRRRANGSSSCGRAPYGTAFSNNYLERGRYAIALSSTGAERGLIDPAVPSVRFVVEEISTPDTARSLPTAGRAAATLADVDGDGDLDVVTAGPAGSALFVNDGTRLTRVTGDAEPPWTAASTSAVIVADFDNDRQPDIAVATAAGVTLLRQARPGRFEDVGKDAGLAGAPAAAALAFVDTDHDGDVDLVAAGAHRGAGGTTSTHLFRNNGTGTFTDVTVEALLATSARDVGVVPTDFDNRRDVDLVFLASDGGPRLMRNLRDGRFEDAAGSTGLSATPGGRAIAAGDVNKDGFTDFFITRDGDSRFELSDGTGRFKAQPGPAGAEGATAAQLLDYDNDGVLDLVGLVAGGVRVWRNLGQHWQDVTPNAVDAPARSAEQAPAAAEALAAGDVDGDGDTDLVLVAPNGRVRLLRNEGGSRRSSLSVRLTGTVSNMSGVGANVELRAGSLWQKLELTSASPSVTPQSLVFGLGSRSRADVVRVLWPSGVLQAETLDGAAAPQARLEITELDRKPSSCPFLYTWTGTRFEFLTDFLGGGEMGYLVAPGVSNQPDPDEYVRIPGDRLVPRDGRFELRITNELEETVFLDRLQLLAVRHPAGTQVFPAEGLKSPPFAPFGLYLAPSLRAPFKAVDERGRDVLDTLREIDRRTVDGFEIEPIRGYAKRHSLTIDLADPSASKAVAAGPDGRILLVLTGWTDYAFSSDNVAAHQAGLTLEPPALQVKDARGRWQTVIPEIGVPVGRPQSVVIDLTGKFLSQSREVRIVTTMRVYWDRAVVDTSGRARFLSGAALEVGSEARGGVAVTRLEPIGADLAWRGFSAEVRPDGREPPSYDYDRVGTDTPWKLMPGRYTREGDVLELVSEVDDMFVVSRPGDELALAFDARHVSETGDETTQTYLLFAYGYSKEMDVSSASPDQVAPLPFRGMSSYPYVAPERYPDTAEHRDYLARYNTRVVSRVAPPLLVGTSDISHELFGSTPRRGALTARAIHEASLTPAVRAWEHSSLE